MQLAKGMTIFLTGLPAAGKSTLGKALCDELRKSTTQPVTLLDGDAVRKNISSDLGFSKADRCEHIRRVGSFAAEITAQGGICICALIAPYDEARKTVRQMISVVGCFFLVYVNTPISVCEARDPKGMYGKARAGTLARFTGVSDPYEAPDDAEVAIDTTCTSAEAAARAVLEALRRLQPRSGERS